MSDFIANFNPTEKDTMVKEDWYNLTNQLDVGVKNQTFSNRCFSVRNTFFLPFLSLALIKQNNNILFHKKYSIFCTRV